MNGVLPVNVGIKEMINKKTDNEELSSFLLEQEVELIVKASVRVQCSYITRSKALLIFHNFKRCNDATKYDPHLVAISCLDLSAKYHEEEDVPLDAIVLVFFGMFETGVTLQEEKFKLIKKSVLTMECLILRMLEFSLSHKLAHEYSVYFLHDLREELSIINVWSAVTETCTRIMCDFYLTNRCLNYTAKQIAAAAIDVSLYKAAVQLHNKKKSYLKSLSDDSKRLDIIEDIFKICNAGPMAEKMLTQRV